MSNQKKKNTQKNKCTISLKYNQTIQHQYRNGLHCTINITKWNFQIPPKTAYSTVLNKIAVTTTFNSVLHFPPIHFLPQPLQKTVFLWSQIWYRVCQSSHKWFLIIEHNQLTVLWVLGSNSLWFTISSSRKNNHKISDPYF